MSLTEHLALVLRVFIAVAVMVMVRGRCSLWPSVVVAVVAVAVSCLTVVTTWYVALLFISYSTVHASALKRLRIHQLLFYKKRENSWLFTNTRHQSKAYDRVRYQWRLHVFVVDTRQSSRWEYHHSWSSQHTGLVGQAPPGARRENRLFCHEPLSEYVPPLKSTSSSSDITRNFVCCLTGKTYPMFSMPLHVNPGLSK